MHTKPVAEIIKRHNNKHYGYDDDTWVYMTLQLCDKFDNIVSRIEASSGEIHIWMSNNMLRIFPLRQDLVI